MTPLCPDCRHPLPVDPQRCPACGLLLAGPAAAELWRVDQQLASLTQRRTQLLGWLRAGASDVRPPSAPPGPVDPLPVDTTRPRSVQRLLLGLGVLLIVVAGLVFVAVSWRTLGVTGQVAVVAGAAVLACVASRLLERTGLLASAEAVAVLGTGLVGVGLVAARTLGLGVAARLDGETYAAVATGSLAVLTAASGLRSRTHAWSIVATAAAVATVGLGLEAARGEQLAGGIAFALAAGGLWLVGLVPATWLRIARPARVAAVVCALACWGLAPVAAWSEDPPTALGCAGVGLAVATAVVIGCAGSGGPAQLWSAHPRLALTAVLATAVQVASGTSSLPLGAEAAVAVLAAAAVVVAAWRPVGLRASWVGVIGLAALVAFWLVSADLVAQLDWNRSPGWGDLETPGPAAARAAVLVALGAGLAAATAVGLRRAALRDAVTGTGALCLLLATPVALSTTNPSALVVGLAVLGAASAVWAWGRSSEAGEGLALLAAVLAEAAALLVAVEAFPLDVVPAAAVVSVTGVVALAYGFRAGRAWSWWVGAVLVPVGVWMVLLDAEVGTVEAFSLPLGLTCLLAGGLGWTRRRGLSSWAVVGPALVVALLPSALVSVNDESALRPLLVLAAGVVLLLVGVWRRWQALVVVPGIAVVVVAFSQLGPWAYGLPRWLSLGVAGALLLAVGVRYEARRRNVVSAARWLRALH